tara:strand:+ start:707 stop:1210 length:504 start_codon:yes stop_codon:yes gene_type:complete
MVKKNDNTLLFLIGIGILYLIYKDSQVDIIQVNNIIKNKKRAKRINEPRRFYDSKYISRKDMEINIPTRGEPPDYQQVGIITGEGEENIKPLYGRQTYRGSNQWNYFTSLDSHLATKIPVFMDGEDCTDERGCKELNKGDTINMGDTDNEYKASIYGTVAPRYIPHV